MTARIADELPLEGEIIWLRDNHAGIAFDNPTGREALRRLNRKSGAPRRRTVPRITAAARALVRMNGRKIPAELCDISSFGAKLRTKADLVPNRPAVVDLPDMPSISAYVRWSDGGESGLVFVTPIPMQVIGHWIDGRIRVSA